MCSFHVFATFSTYIIVSRFFVGRRVEDSVSNVFLSSLKSVVWM